jgi:RNA polymerase sigma factor (sigma-70 family)
MELGAALDPIRVQAATHLLATQEAALRRTARRFSLCADDADDAFQRAVEILLTKVPAIGGDVLTAWMQVVTRREALALRRTRERMLGIAGIDGVLSNRPEPAEHAERRELVAEAARRLARLKPDERRAIVLQAEGYSYAEICKLTGWTYTKVNRCLAEGRARLRMLSPAA